MQYFKHISRLNIVLIKNKYTNDKIYIQFFIKTKNLEICFISGEHNLDLTPVLISVSYLNDKSVRLERQEFIAEAWNFDLSALF